MTVEYRCSNNLINVLSYRILDASHIGCPVSYYLGTRVEGVISREHRYTEREEERERVNIGEIVQEE